MRIALVSLLALAAGANAFARTTTAPTTPPAPAAAPAPASPAPAATAPAPPATTPAPATTAPAAAASAAPTPTASTATAAPAAPGAPAAQTTNVAAAPPAPPPPPAAPTDPTAIAVLDVLKKVCIPAANGGNFQQLAKADGYRKNSDNNWVLKAKDFTITLENPGSNPTQCHVDLTHPLDTDSPGKPIVVALNDWAAVENGWSLYRNDKNVQGDMLYTTRSWQLDWNGKEQSLVFTNMRKPDGSPLHGGVDTSQLIYGVSASAS